MSDSEVRAVIAVARNSRWVRIGGVLAVSFLVGLLLPLLQLRLAKGVELVDVNGPFEAGNERVVSVAPTLALWFCAITVPLVVSLVPALFKAGLPARMFAAAAAAAGVFYAQVPVERSVAPQLRPTVAGAALVGMAFGLLVGVAVARWPILGHGVGVHAAALWLLAVLLPDASLYAGAVSLRWPSGEDLVLVSIVQGAASAWLAYRVVLRGRRRLVGILCGVIGPVMAAIVYPVSPYQHVLWDEAAGQIATIVAVIALVVTWAAATLAKARRATSATP